MLVIYTKDNCIFCTKAKQYLQSNSIPYREINVNHDLEALSFLKKEKHTTVPQLYYNDYTSLSSNLFVKGGYEGLIKAPLTEVKQKLNIK